MKWHAEALDEAGRRAAERLAAAAGREFYLAGGTALALRLGHRVSLDLDLFSRENALGLAERTRLLEALGSSGELKIVESKDGTCHLRLGATAASLFHYPYPLLEAPEDWNGLGVAALADIAAMKLSAAVGRGSKKDFVDLYHICRLMGLATALQAADRKFPQHSDFALQAARALVFFDDAEKEPMPRLLLPAAWGEVKSYFEAEVPKFLRRQMSRPPQKPGRRRKI